MTERYYTPNPITVGRHRLSGPEAHHLSAVMRAEAGQEITLFDGTGVECTASIVKIGKRDVELEILERAEVSREPTIHLTLAVALPKGDRQKWLVEKAVELGVAKLVPLVCQRSVAKAKESSIERLQRNVIEASKQCGRNLLMSIAKSKSFEECLPSFRDDTMRLIAHPPLNAAGNTPDERLPEHSNVVALIGPEGGFTDDEVETALAEGWQPISLGRRILRTETAALKIAASILRD